MSKQRGQYQYTGRLGTTVGYSQRYAKDRYLRSVSEGQSERVKTSPNYENLRLYNGEFKHVAEFSSLVFRNMPDRFSTMLKPHRVAELNKRLLPLLNGSTHDFGYRDISEAGNYQEDTYEYLLSLRKSYLFDRLSMDLSFSLDEEEDDGFPLRIHLNNMPPDDVVLKKLGINIFTVRVFGLYLECSLLSDPTLNLWTPAKVICDYLGQYTTEIPSSHDDFLCWVKDLSLYERYLMIYQFKRNPNLVWNSDILLNQFNTFTIESIDPPE